MGRPFFAAAVTNRLLCCGDACGCILRPALRRDPRLRERGIERFRLDVKPRQHVVAPPGFERVLDMVEERDRAPLRELDATF
jgi:hypothetical protein